MLVLLLLVGSSAFAADKSGKTTGLFREVSDETVTLKLGSGSAGKEYNLVGRYFITASQSLVGGFAHAVFTPDYVTLASKMGCEESTLNTAASYWFPVPNADYKETNGGNNWLNANGEKTVWDNGNLNRYFIQIDNGDIWFGQYPGKYPSGSSVDGTVYLVSTDAECNNVVEIKYLFNFVPSATTYHRFVADYVDAGNTKSESSHNLNCSQEIHGGYSGQTYRHVAGGHWFCYDLSLANVTNDMKDKVSLVVRYWGSDGSDATDRYFNIMVDDVIIRNQMLEGNTVDGFIEYEYPVDPALLKDKDHITVKFQSAHNKYAGGVYFVKLCTGYSVPARSLTAYQFNSTDFRKNEHITINSTENNVVHFTGDALADYNFNIRISRGVKDVSYMPDQYLFVIAGTGFKEEPVFLWWLMGYNYNLVPTKTKTVNGTTYLIFDLRLNNSDTFGLWGNEEVPFATANNDSYALLCFGLTPTDDNTEYKGTLSDAAFYSPHELYAKYPDVFTLNEICEFTGYVANQQFIHDGYVYQINEDNTAVSRGMKLSVDAKEADPEYVNGYPFALSMTNTDALPTYTADHHYNVSVTRNLQAGYNTIALPFDVASVSETFGEGAFVAQLSDATETDGVWSLTFNKGNQIEANAPYILCMPEAKETIGFGLQQVKAAKSTSVEYDKWSMKSNYTPGFSMSGLYGVVPSTGKVMRGGSSATLNGLAAYLEFAGVGNVRAVSVFDEETGIQTTFENNVSRDCFDLSGRKDSHSAVKGVYIVNGKKYIR